MTPIYSNLGKESPTPIPREWTRLRFAVLPQEWKDDWLYNPPILQHRHLWWRCGVLKQLQLWGRQAEHSAAQHPSSKLGIGWHGAGLGSNLAHSTMRPLSLLCHENVPEMLWTIEVDSGPKIHPPTWTQLQGSCSRSSWVWPAAPALSAELHPSASARSRSHISHP